LSCLNCANLEDNKEFCLIGLLLVFWSDSKGAALIAKDIVLIKKQIIIMEFRIKNKENKEIFLNNFQRKQENKKTRKQENTNIFILSNNI
jgi:hypothetical protein